MGRKAAVRVRHATGANALMETSMNVLEMIRAQMKRDKALKAAQKQLCYRGVVYDKEKLSNIC